MDKLQQTLTLHLHICITYDPSWHDTDEERDWFIRTIINNATLHSHIIPEPIGTITVIREEHPQKRPTPSQGIKALKA